MSTPARTPSGWSVDWRATFERARVDASRQTAAAMAVAARRGFVLTDHEARASGMTPAAARALVRAGRWYRPRRGTLCVLSRAAVAGLGSEAAHQIEAAAAARVRRRTAVSHRSAAVVHGLPLLGRPGRPSVTSIGPTERGTGVESGVVRAARLESWELRGWFGVPVTSPARTVVDLARQDGRRAGLVAADAAVRSGLMSVADLTAALGGRSHWPGIRAAREIVDLIDPRAESALETLTRLMVHDAGLPAPVSQWWVDLGDVRYRADLAWPQRLVIVEADGALKYDEPTALWDEKRRQERLERAGWIVVRVTWDDVLRHPAPTVERIRAALRRYPRSSLTLV